MKIGIFGGSFNPPHCMHKQIALDLISKHYVDQVIYVPTGDSYQKENLISAHHRYEMLKLMVDNYPNLFVSDYELGDHLTYTYQTLDYFRKKFSSDEIYFICGSDNLKDITTWKKYQYILKHYKLLVIQRDSEIIDTSFSNVIQVRMLPFSISSTLIRNHIKDPNVYSYLDERVLHYINVHHLYENL